MREVTFPLTGHVHEVVCDGGWPKDNPRGFATLSASPQRRVGRGYQVLVTMRSDDAVDLAGYLMSVAGAWESMTLEERGTTDRPAVIRAAVTRIHEALLQEDLRDRRTAQTVPSDSRREGRGEHEPVVLPAERGVHRS